MHTPTTAASFVSVVIPCRNEARYIRACIESLLNTTHPANRLEILVVDGQSTDGTLKVVSEVAAQHPNVRLLNNPRRISPVAMNIGIEAAQGDVVVIAGAHAEYQPDYVATLLAHLESSGAVATGGLVVTAPGASDAMSAAIAIALGHPFGIGSAKYKTGVAVPTFVDTVPFGCYIRSAMRAVGNFNEALVRTQDMDLNIRLREAGGRLLLVPSVATVYYARTGLLDFARYRVRSGFWPLNALRFGAAPFSIRHLVPGLFAGALLFGALLSLLHPLLGALVLGAALVPHTLLNLAVTAHEARRRRRPALMLTLPLAFLTMHLAYGAGILAGVARVLPLKAARRSLWARLRPRPQGPLTPPIPMPDRRQGMPLSKRLFDVTVASLALVALVPLGVAVAVWIAYDSGFPIFFRQQRVGRDGRLFGMLKFRTMVRNAPHCGTHRTAACDPRITRVGRVLRNLKIDELPQLVNVLFGDMSLVGPRPMVPEQVAQWDEAERVALTLTPGITDYASIRFHNENDLLRGSGDVQGAYNTMVRAEKTRLVRRYIENQSLVTDVRILCSTLDVLLRSRLLPRPRTEIVSVRRMVPNRVTVDRTQ